MINIVSVCLAEMCTKFRILQFQDRPFQEEKRWKSGKKKVAVGEREGKITKREENRGFYSRLLASFFELGMYWKDFKMYGTFRQ